MSQLFAQVAGEIALGPIVYVQPSVVKEFALIGGQRRARSDLLIDPGQAAVVDQRDDLGALVEGLADAIGNGARDQMLFDVGRLRVEAHEHGHLFQRRARSM